jgi:hypothetical protein|tara:strand:+ start:1082 stop:1357 length:276 start_codon:yes stop_codon:yes gene_type:complete
MIGQKMFTKSLTNASLTIDSAEGITQVSILCTTSVAGTVLGTGVIGGTSSGALNIAENTSLTLGASSGFPITGLTINAPSGCILEITGSLG